MGMKDWLEKKQKEIEEKLRKAEDPNEQKAARKEGARKTAERTVKGIKLAKFGIDKYNDAAKKVEEMAKDAGKKAITLADKAKPVAEKIDDAAEAAMEKAKSVLGVTDEKAESEKTSKPKTGAGIIDIFAPAVPETDAEKPKPQSPPPPPVPPQ